MSQSHPSQQQQTSAAPPSVYAVALFPGWQLLDVAGPLDVLNLLQQDHPDFKLYILSHTLDPVPTQTSAESSTFSQSVVPTHTYDSCPDDVQVLLIPGGMGARQAELIGPVKEFVQRTYPSLQFLLTVCTGSAIVAQAGILDGRRATSNKRSFAFVGSFRNVEKLPSSILSLFKSDPDPVLHKCRPRAVAQK